MENTVASLLDRAKEDANLQNFTRAYGALQQAANIDPGNVKVQQALAALNFTESSGDVLKILKQYLDQGEDATGQQLLKTLSHSALPASVAIETIDLLIQPQAPKPKLDAITGALLGNAIDARRSLAARLNEHAAELFDEFGKRGGESLKALTALPTENGLWPSKQRQSALQEEIFALCCADLIGANAKSPDVALGALVRLLNSGMENVTEIIDYDVFRGVLAYLDIRRGNAIRSQATLASSKILEALHEKGEGYFRTFITASVASQAQNELTVAFSAAAAMFPIIPALTTNLFTTDGFIQQLIALLERNSSASRAKKSPQAFERATLELFSAACVDKSCRELLSKNCVSWLRKLSGGQGSEHKALATLVLAKIGLNDPDDIAATLSELALEDDPESAIEGLAYITLQPKTKERVASDEKLLRNLVTCLAQRTQTTFGCLTVIGNLTQYKPARSEEDKKMAQLKAYANSSKPVPDDPLDSDSNVTARCKKVLDAGITPALLACCKRTSSMTIIAAAVRVFHSLAKEQKHRPTMAQQGAIRQLLQIRESVSQTNKSNTDTAAIEFQAAHALARILISVNPSHVFSAALPATTAVHSLVLLTKDNDEGGQRNLLPLFEGLLALTNLAAMEDGAARDLQLRILWDVIENLMLSHNTLVQRASIELICNLMVSPAGVAKFADGSKAAARRLQILLALADAEDLLTRRASGGALAMLTEWDAAVNAILQKPAQVKRLLEMCEDESEEISHRGLVCVLNVVSAPEKVGEHGVTAVRDADGVAVVTKALKATRNAELLKLGVDILKRLK